MASQRPEPSGTLSLSGQVALVTGGGRGLGPNLASALAAAGAAVAVAARTVEEIARTVVLIESEGGRVVSVAVDVTEGAAVERMVAEVERRLGHIDILVNNAGRAHTVGAVWQADPDDWWRDVEVNLRGPFLCARAVLPSMLNRRRGRIINVASGAGLFPCPSFSGYSASKAALIRLSESLARETKDMGISVFAISPGLLRTPMTDYLRQADAAWPGAPSGQTIFERERRRLEEGDEDSPELAARLVVYLASGRADALSGRYLGVGDDIDETVRRAEEIARDDLYALRLRK